MWHVACGETNYKYSHVRVIASVADQPVSKGMLMHTDDALIMCVYLESNVCKYVKLRLFVFCDRKH